MYEKIKKLCKEQNISVSELEKKLEFSSGSICKWNVNVPSIMKVKLVADFFDVSIEYLLKEGAE